MKRLTKVVLNLVKTLMDYQPVEIARTPFDLTRAEVPGKYLVHIYNYGTQYGLVTKLRMAHFLAQIDHESGKFRWSREIWGPTSHQLRYEFNQSLGNTQSGDGYRFRGRGLIHITGRYNYRVFGRKIGVDLITNPELATEPEIAVRLALEFWKDRNLNLYADGNDIVTITRRINGGTNGLADRNARLAWYLNRI
jgi:putative chitinase